jgi:hypothetical protein
VMTSPDLFPLGRLLFLGLTLDLRTATGAGINLRITAAAAIRGHAVHLERQGALNPALRLTLSLLLHEGDGGADIVKVSVLAGEGHDGWTKNN